MKVLNRLTIDEAALAGIVAEPLCDIEFPRAVMVTEAGVLLAALELWTKDAAERSGERFVGHLLVALKDGVADYHLVPPDMTPRLNHRTSFAAYRGGLIVYVAGRERHWLYHVGRSGGAWEQPKPLELMNDMPVLVSSKGHPRKVEIGKVGIGEGSFIAFNCGCDIGDIGPEARNIRSCAFLEPDLESGQATWHLWPERAAPMPPRGGLLSRFLGRNAVVPDLTPALEPERFLKLRPEDFPTFKGDADTVPNVGGAAFVGGKVLVHTDGANRIYKYGVRCAALVEIDRTGGLLRKLMYENFIAASRPDASKKHEHKMAFTDGGRQIILRSQYKSTDPWGGHGAALDCETGQITKLTRPRGFKDYDVVALHGARVWMAHGPEQAKQVELVEAERAAS